MATWNSDNIILTKLGEQVLSKVQSGVGKLTVSRIVSGAGHVSPAQLYSQTQITDIKQEMSVVKYTTNEQQSVISANLTNTGLEEAYDLYQIGIYVTHPDFTDEVLYLIAQCDSPDHIPLPGDSPVTLSYDLVMAHFGTKEVTINVSEAGHVDVTTFNEFIEKTNTALNRKADLSDIPTTLPANGGNADTVDGHHAYEFSQIVDYGDSPTSTKTAIGIPFKTTTYWCSHWTDYPATAPDGQGMIIAVNYKGSGTTGTDSIWCRQIFISPHDSKIYQRLINQTTVGEWASISDLGYHFADRTRITSGDLNTITTQGQFVVTSATTTDTLANQPWTTSGYYLDVYRRNTDAITQIALRWDGKIALRYLSGTTWSNWVVLIDSNIVASSTSFGIVSTGTQQFAGYKIFPTQIAIKTAGTVGTQPTSDINSRMFFTNTAVNAQFGEVRNCIRDSSFTTGEVFTSIHAFSNDHTGSNTIKVVATNNNSGNYVSIGAPTVASSVSCLRNLSSGTASANTTNCPSGAWYGKHS